MTYSYEQEQEFFNKFIAQYATQFEAKTDDFGFRVLDPGEHGEFYYALFNAVTLADTHSIDLDDETLNEILDLTMPLELYEYAQECAAAIRARRPEAA